MHILTIHLFAKQCSIHMQFLNIKLSRICHPFLYTITNLFSSIDKKSNNDKRLSFHVIQLIYIFNQHIFFVN